MEDPIIRHNGEIRKCRVATSGINPLNVYNDETQKLTYYTLRQKIHGRPIRSIDAFEKVKEILLKIIFLEKIR